MWRVVGWKYLSVLHIRLHSLIKVAENKNKKKGILILGRLYYMVSTKRQYTEEFSPSVVIITWPSLHLEKKQLFKVKAIVPGVDCAG